MIAAWRRLPLGLLGALLMIVVVERAIAGRMIAVTTHVASSWGFAAEAARGDGARSEILGFGDSLIKFGFLPQIIQKRTGRTAYNLAALAGPSSRDYQILKRVLDAGGKPSAIVVCIQVVHLGSGPRSHVRHFAESVTLAEALDLAWTSRDPGLFASLMIERRVPSIRARFEIRGNLMRALRGEEGVWTPLFYPLRRNWNRSRGAHIVPEEHHSPDDPAAAEAHARELYPYDFADVSDQVPVHEIYIRRFLNLAAQRKIPVFWVLPPMLPAVEDRQQRVALTALSTALARRVQVWYPEVVVVDGRERGYDAGAFVDGVHLNRRGAYVFSRDLADMLRHRLNETSSANLWVLLPRYRPSTMEVELEDTTQSTAALYRPAVRR